MIGYHYLIEPDGKIKVGRVESQHGAHCIGCNHNSLGICLTGNFDIENPTKDQEKSLKVLLIDLLKGYPKAQIKYHRDFANKTCPGKLISNDWAKNLIANKKTMFVKKVRDGKIYAVVGNKLIHWNTVWGMFNENFENATIIELNKKEFAKFEIVKNVSIKK